MMLNCFVAGFCFMGCLTDFANNDMFGFSFNLLFFILNLFFSFVLLYREEQKTTLRREEVFLWKVKHGISQEEED